MTNHDWQVLLLGGLMGYILALIAVFLQAWFGKHE